MFEEVQPRGDEAGTKVKHTWPINMDSIKAWFHFSFLPIIYKKKCAKLPQAIPAMEFATLYIISIHFLACKTVNDLFSLYFISFSLKEETLIRQVFHLVCQRDPILVYSVDPPPLKSSDSEQVKLRRIT